LDIIVITWITSSFGNITKREKVKMTTIAWFIFIAAAILEVAGDAIIRKGLHGNVMWFIAAGFLMLGGYGLVVNTVKWDFSRLLGVYVAIFAAVSILAGRFVFKETIPASTWLGLAIIVVGGTVIQLGPELGK
jgi:drug/metabolite transporter superfamily protein YnfA